MEKNISELYVKWREEGIVLTGEYEGKEAVKEAWRDVLRR